jgi:hypothetical protein
MPKLLPEQKMLLLLSLSKLKKIAFLILLFERMEPELRSYFIATGRDVSVIQQARESFWRLLSGDEAFVSWNELRETILDLLPDSEDDGSEAAQFARNAGLVAADIAGLADDGQDSHVTDAITYYASQSIYAAATTEMEIYIYSRAVKEAVMSHPLFQRERQREEDDVTFLSQLPEAPWPDDVVSMLRDRAQAQDALLGTALNGRGRRHGSGPAIKMLHAGLVSMSQVTFAGPDVNRPRAPAPAAPPGCAVRAIAWR